MIYKHLTLVMHVFLLAVALGKNEQDLKWWVIQKRNWKMATLILLFNNISIE